jgi:peptidoglycan/LPS O-acetylase OafA/YrhL
MLQTRNAKRKKLKSLTGLRFFAAIHVVLFHNLGLFSTLPSPIYHLIQHGYTSVSLFFILSGFILAYNYVSTDILEKESIQYFWIARFARIYPIYLLSLFLDFPWFVYFSIKTIPLVLALLKVIGVSLLSLALLQSWVPQSLGQLNAPGWSLSVEVFFYLAFPMLSTRLVKQSSKNLWILGLLLWILALLIPLLFDYIQPDTIIPSVLSTPMQSPYPAWRTFASAFPLFHLPQFIIGIIGGIVFLRNEEQKLCTGSAFAPILDIVALALLFIIFATDFLPGVALNNGLLAPLFILLFYALAHEKGVLHKFLAFSPFIVLGEASYGIYIFQQPIRSWIRNIFSLFGYKFDFHVFLVYLVILCAFSIMILQIDNYVKTPFKNHLITLSNWISGKNNSK